MTVKELTLEKLKNKIIRIARHINGDDFHARRFCFGSLFLLYVIRGQPFLVSFFFFFRFCAFCFSFLSHQHGLLNRWFNLIRQAPAQEKIK